jgi:glyoxylate carboligase
MTVKAQNVWGDKDIIVVSNAYILALVNSDEAIDRAESLQQAYDNLENANNNYGDAILKATTEKELKALSIYKDKIALLQDQIKTLMQKNIANELKGEA